MTWTWRSFQMHFPVLCDRLQSLDGRARLKTEGLLPTRPEHADIPRPVTPVSVGENSRQLFEDGDAGGWGMLGHDGLSLSARRPSSGPSNSCSICSPPKIPRQHPQSPQLWAWTPTGTPLDSNGLPPGTARASCKQKRFAWMAMGSANCASFVPLLRWGLGHVITVRKRQQNPRLGCRPESFPAAHGTSLKHIDTIRHIDDERTVFCAPDLRSQVSFLESTGQRMEFGAFCPLPRYSSHIL